VGATPFRLWKSHTTEGGIAVPAIARLPRQHQARVRLDAVTHITDLAPTFLDLAGAARPGGTYKGKPVHPITGVSLLPALTEKVSRVRPADAVLAWEHANHRFVLRDNWKLVWVAGSYGPTPKNWQLYDLRADRGESQDLSVSRPDLVQELTAAWDRYAASNGVVLLPPPAADGGIDAEGDAGVPVDGGGN
jgi:arylsulfatase